MTYAVEIKPSLGQQIAELKREKLMRERVYPKFIASGSLKQKNADWQMAALEGAIAALEQSARAQDALRPFVEAYARSAEPIGDSDLYNEQPRSVSVTLGDCRKAAMLLGVHPKVRE